MQDSQMIFSNNSVSKNQIQYSVLDFLKKDLEKIDDENHIHPFFQIGFTRGGSNDVGGPLWCDYDEFVDISGINQIFGHIPNYVVRYQKIKNYEYYCIDTKLNHYAVYQIDTMEIKLT